MSDDDKITFPVEASHIMMFSRSIGDFSADYDANAAAPPTYAQSVAQFNPDYSLRMKDDEPCSAPGKSEWYRGQARIVRRLAHGAAF